MANTRLGKGLSWRTGELLRSPDHDPSAPSPVGLPFRDVLGIEAFPAEMLVDQAGSCMGRERLKAAPVFNRINATTGQVW